MIREEDIREFQKIIGRTKYEQEDEEGEEEEEEVSDGNDAIFEDEDAPEDLAVKRSQPVTVSGNTLIIYITAAFGMIFLLTVVIGVGVFFYEGHEKNQANRNKNDGKGGDNFKSSQIWRFPGYRPLITDPEPHEAHIRVWGVRTAVPPEPYMFYYYYQMYTHLFEDEEYC